GTGGMTTVNFGTGTTSGASDLLVLGDGRLLLVGFRRAANNSDFAIVRLNANGAIEDSFTRHFDSNNDVAVSPLLAPDGKIVVVGRNGALNLVSGTTSFVVMRFLPDGLTPDPSFGVDGAVLTNAGAGCCYGANDAVVQPDGAIVVVGRELTG